MIQPNPTVRNIVAVVRESSPEGCTAKYLLRICRADSIQAIEKALELQVDAGIIERFERPDFPGMVLYRVREGA